MFPAVSWQAIYRAYVLPSWRLIWSSVWVVPVPVMVFGREAYARLFAPSLHVLGSSVVTVRVTTVVPEGYVCPFVGEVLTIVGGVRSCAEYVRPQYWLTETKS